MCYPISTMPSLITKWKKGKPYLYWVRSARVNGQSRIAEQIYLGAGARRADQCTCPACPSGAAYLAVSGALPGPGGDQPRHLAQKQAGLRRMVPGHGARPSGARSLGGTEQSALLGSYGPVRGRPLGPHPQGALGQNLATLPLGGAVPGL